MPKTKFTKFKNFESSLRGKNNQTVNEQHIRLTRSLLLSPAYKDLSKNALKIFNAMKLISKGEKEFDFSCSLGTYYLGISNKSEKSVRLAIKELVNHGFIQCIHYSNGAGHIPNRYKFFDEWIKWSK